MGVTSTSVRDGNEIVIKVSGAFDFSVHEQFRSAYQDYGPHTIFTVDLRRTDHLDSSALGMLLLLRKHAGEDRSEVRLINANSTVQRVFEIAQFDRLFSLS